MDYVGWKIWITFFLLLTTVQGEKPIRGLSADGDVINKGDEIVSSKSEKERTVKTNKEQEVLDSSFNSECDGAGVCSSWSEWLPWSTCCPNKTCTVYDVTIGLGIGVRMRERSCNEDVSKDCIKEHEYTECPRGRAENDPGGVLNNPETGSSSSGSAVKTIAFAMSGTVLVALLLFAVVRLRKTSINRRRGALPDTEMQGFDNEVGPLSSDSRIQTILNTINASGRNYELRERADSIPGRRVYVLSPTLDNHQLVGRGRHNRMTSQLSSIAEEEPDDALSHVTETMEPAEEDECVFKYDSDAINEIQSLHSPCNHSHVRIEDEDGACDVSTVEAMNYMNDVIAMYDVDNETNGKLKNKEQSRISAGDFRVSGDYENESFLRNFGWSPQKRPWKVQSLKEEKGKWRENLAASCSTLDSQFSEKSGLTSSVSLRDVTRSENGSRNHILGNGDMTSSTKSVNEKTSLSNSVNFKSLPSVLDTSQIPDIDEMLHDGVTSSIDDEIRDEQVVV